MAICQDVQTLRKLDPIWKSLRLRRILRILLLLFYLCLGLSQLWYNFTSWKSYSLYLIFCALSFNAILGNEVFQHFKNEKYWIRIGWRRCEALNRLEVIKSRQESDLSAQLLTLPVTISFHWNRMIISIIIGGLLALYLMLAIPFFIQMQQGEGSGFVIVTALMSFILIYLFVFYINKGQYFSQKIELTDEGIKTRYMGQTRFLCWKNARIFAVYKSEVRKTKGVETFELSNAETVVRWSKQQFLINPFMRVDSTIGNDDFNWLVDRINAEVRARIDLELLDFNDRPEASQRKTFSPVQPTYQKDTSDLFPRDEDDSWLRTVTARGEAQRGLIIGLCFFIVITIIGALCTFGIFPEANVGSSLFFVCGILMVVVMVLCLLFFLRIRHFMNHIAALRQDALTHPEKYRSTGQPAPREDIPQPNRVRLQLALLWSLLMGLSEGLALGTLLAFTIQQARATLWIMLTIIAGVTLFTTILVVPLSRSKPAVQRIEVREDGIATLFGNVENFIRWQDARLFVVHPAYNAFGGRSSRSELYMLSNRQTAVRWRRDHSPMITTNPHMSKEELERWFGHLNGVIVAKTDLPLLRLNDHQEGE